MRAGEDVRLLVFFDTPAPGYPKLLQSRRAYWRELRRGVDYREVAEHLAVVGRMLRQRIASTTVRAGLPVEQKVDPRAHAASLYTPRPIDVPMVQFIAGDDIVSTRVLDDPRLGWRDVGRAGFEVRRIAGAHPTLFLEQLPTDLTAGLREVLSAAQR